jgi:hypothetical protein
MTNYKPFSPSGSSAGFGSSASIGAAEGFSSTALVATVGFLGSANSASAGLPPTYQKTKTTNRVR